MLRPRGGEPWGPSAPPKGGESPGGRVLRPRGGGTRTIPDMASVQKQER